MLTAANDESTSTGFGNGSGLGVGITLEDLRCPICVETIKDPFVTTCGHTFCFTCITTHLRNKRSCPSCAVYITQESIHPNFLLNKITHKASTINPEAPSSLLDHVTRLLSVAGSSVKVHEVQQVIELLDATKARLQEQENTNNLELLLLFLQHARVQKEQQLQELQRQMTTLERDLSSARMRCDRGNKAATSGASSMLPYHQLPQQQPQQQQQLPGPDSGATVPMLLGPARASPSQLPIPPQPGLPMLQPPPITTIPMEAYSYLPQDSGPKPNLLPTASQGTDAPLDSGRSHASYPSGPHSNPAAWAAAHPSSSAGAAAQQQPQPQQSHPSGSRGAPGSSGGVGFRPYNSAMATASQPASGSGQLGPSTSHPAANPPTTPLQSASTSNNSNHPAAGAAPPLSHPPRCPPDPARQPTPPAPPEAIPASSSAHSAANTVTGPDALGQAGLPPLPPPASAANEALRAAKRRRIMMQFDELQQCYLRLRHTSQQGGALRGPSQAAAAEAPIGAIEDDAGLDLFTQMLCAATHYAKLAVVAELPRSTSRPASILSSIEFDMDEQLFATAGVTQKISVYDFASIMAAPREQHSAVVEIPARSKLSCISWSPAVRHHLISSDYEGIVQLWDVATRTSLQEYEAHERRIWSVDFNPADPQYFASGSDDGKVKVWSTADAAPAINIDVKANVCSVQYNPQVSYSLAVGSANHSVLLYDLRKARDPLATYTGHRKAVSYVRFANSFELISASTDSTLRLWDIRASRCVRTFSGHGNEKNFVGLSVDGEFIACGSETNKVYVYYKAIPKPTMHHSFASGGEGDTAPGHFVTSVCWKRGYNHLVAANSSGSIWIMSLVD